MSSVPVEFKDGYKGNDTRWKACGVPPTRMVCSRLYNNVENHMDISLNKEVNILESLTINARTTQYHMNYIKFMLKSLMSVNASVTSSSCIQYGQPLHRDKWQLHGEHWCVIQKTETIIHALLSRRAQESYICSEWRRVWPWWLSAASVRE